MAEVRIVVVGGGGFLGGHLLASLRQCFGGEARFLVAGRRTAVGVDGQYLEGDRSDPALLRELVAWNPHIWFDLALFRPAEMEALLSTLEGVPGLVRIVVAGTVAEYGLHRALPRPLSEDFPLEPEGRYGREKAAAWELARPRVARGLPLSWAVLPQLWGPGDPHGRDALYAHRISDHEPMVLRGSGRTLMPDGYAGTVAEALVHLGLQDVAAGRYNICGGTSLTPLTFLRQGAAALERPATVLHVEPGALGRLLQESGSEFRPVFGDYDLLLDTTRLQRSGFRQGTSAALGVRKTVQWHASNRTSVAVAFDIEEALVRLVVPVAQTRIYG